MMNNALKMGLLTLALGAVFGPTDANAAVATYISYSNATNYCQAFTPGVTNTIRNRVHGSENIGDPLAVACSFPLTTNGAAGQGNLSEIGIWFANNGTVATTVTCTMLTGAPSGISNPIYAVTKVSASIAPGSFNSILFTAADNPTAGSLDFGNLVVGVNCTLPTNMILSATRIKWSADNGV
jgi:hypothetical protein